MGHEFALEGGQRGAREDPETPRLDVGVGGAVLGEGEGTAEADLGDGGVEVGAGGVPLDDGFVEGSVGGWMELFLVELCVVFLDRVITVDVLRCHPVGVGTHVFVDFVV